MLETEQSDYAREKLNERLANLNGGVALIKIGASTELELKEKKYRYEDALNATRAAIECGIVPGGGTCLLRISETLEQKVEVDPKDPDELLGVRILAKAIRTPFMKICENGGFSPEVYASKVLEASYPIGFDAKYGEICDLFERGVIDPSKVVKSSLTNAVSIATLVFTTETLIAPVVDKNEKILISEPMY
jgi:chaperonin GroEL